LVEAAQGGRAVNRPRLRRLWTTAAALLTLAFVFAIVSSAGAGNSPPVTGAAFTSVNEGVDGPDHCKNGNPNNNCNLYDGKEFVWLNGGPSTAYVGDGSYFFAVLQPGGQYDPNDGGANNLSDDFDTYGDRTFSVSGSTVSYSGPHDFDSNKIRLADYADTLNPGGVYILAICSLDKGYPVRPARCKYDAFKIRAGQVEFPENLGVTKSVFPSLNHEFSWSITKTADNCPIVNPCTLNGGGSAVINYVIKITHDEGADTNWLVEGVITVSNPNGSDVTGVDVTDSVDNGGTCDVDDTLGTSPTDATIPGSGSIDFHYKCTWSSDPSSADGTNTASACWDEQTLADPAGKLAAGCQTFDAPFLFEDPTPIDDCATVSDTYPTLNELGTVCVGDTGEVDNKDGTFSFSFPYQRTINFDPTVVPGCANYGNTASFVDNSDPVHDGSASVTVRVCHYSAALTPGYWKTHLTYDSKHPTAPYTAKYLPICLGGTWNGTDCTGGYLSSSVKQYAVKTTANATSVFNAMNCNNTGSNSQLNQNAIGCLAGHLLAAKLNVANGSNPCISTTITNADALLSGDHYIGPTGNYTGITNRAAAITLKSALDKYNNGGGC
jgi:hypothetical protein